MRGDVFEFIYIYIYIYICKREKIIPSQRVEWYVASTNQIAPFLVGQKKRKANSAQTIY